MQYVWSFDYRSDGACHENVLLLTPAAEVLVAIRTLIDIVGDEDLHVSRTQLLGPLLNGQFPRLAQVA